MIEQEIKSCLKTESGRSVYPCTTLLESIRAEVIEQNTFSTTLKSTGERIHRVGTCSRKYKGKYAVFSNCPFCGANIDTQDYGLVEAKEEG